MLTSKTPYEPRSKTKRQMNKNNVIKSMLQGDQEPFIAFYNKHHIIPVTQDTEQPDFIFRRNSLYKLLGIPLHTLKDRTVLEFGPGGGYNALAITHQAPKRYVFVDASLASLDELKRKVETKSFGNVETEIVDCNIMHFEDDRKFDLVIVEGVIPGQKNPRSMLKHVSKFVSEEGFLVITTTSAASMLSEVCRRVFFPYITSTHKSFEDQVLAAIQIFQPHLTTLKTTTRPIRDWVLDSIFNPWESSNRMCFTILDSVEALGSEYDFYGSSPRFLIDDRFYKAICPKATTSSKLVEQQFPSIAFALIDYRIEITKALKHCASRELEPACKEAYDLHSKMLTDNSYNRLDDFLACLQKIPPMIPAPFEATRIAIHEFIELFPKFLYDVRAEVKFRDFPCWWGRGQQYVSLIRAGAKRLHR